MKAKKATRENAQLSRRDAHTLAMVRKSEKDIAAGRVRPVAAALREIASRYKLSMRG